MAHVPLVRLHQISKSFPGVKALDGVSLDLRPGTVHAFVGENGAGKSTLINILGGIFPPDEGTYLFRGAEVRFHDARDARERGIAAVHQEADVFPDLSVAENLAFEHGWPAGAVWSRGRRLREQTRTALENLGVTINPRRPAGRLSAAERQLVGLAGALHRRAALLILDEPTSSLSGAETRVLFDRLRHFREQGGAVLYVSHRLEEIFQLADEVTVLRDGRVVEGGPVRDTTPGRLVLAMVGRDTPRVPAPEAPRTDVVRFRCEGMTDVAGRFRDVGLEVRGGEILGMYGLIGAGRSEWAQSLFGLQPLANGQVWLHGKPFVPSSPAAAGRCGLVYLPEDRLSQGIFPNLSVRANAVVAALRRLAVGPFVLAHRERRETQQIADRLRFRLRSLGQPIRTLSGGNQQKVVLGRWLACEPDVLVLDEPTRGIDVGAKAEIHSQLRRLAEGGKAIVLISSDLPEVLNHSNRVVVFREGRLARVFDVGRATPEEVAEVALPEVGRTFLSVPAVRTDRNVRPTGIAEWIRETGLLAAVLVLMIFLSFRTGTFWKAGTLQDMGESAAILAVAGLGAALVILAGSIDISLGSIMALGSAVAGHLMRLGYSPLLAAGAGLGTGAVAGFINAALSLAGGIHPIVVTLGTLSLYRGLTQLLLAQEAIHDVRAAFRDPILAAPLEIPSAVWLAGGLFLTTWLALGWTIPGRELYALGSNRRKAERCGLHPRRILLTVFTVQGLLAALAGLLALGRAGHLQATDFEEVTLEAIGVAVVGGIAITGGRGSVWGVAGAALFFRVLEKGWVLLRISSYWQRTVVGGLLLLAILGDRLLRRVGESERKRGVGHGKTGP